MALQGLFSWPGGIWLSALVLAFLLLAALLLTSRYAREAPSVLPWFVAVLGATVIAAGLRLAMHTTAVLWGTTFFGLTLIVLSLGRIVQGHWRGVFVNGRNRWSLSQTQAIAWTLLVLTGFLSYWWVRILDGEADPQALLMDDRLWQLMGLTTGTMGITGYIHHRQGTGAPRPEVLGPFRTSDLRWRFKQYERAYRNVRDDGPEATEGLERRLQATVERQAAQRRKTLDASLPPRARLATVDEVRDALQTANVSRRAESIEEMFQRSTGEARKFLAVAYDRADRVLPMGRLVRNLEVTDAHPGEMFQSETVGNAHRADVGKVQLFLLSLAAMTMFAVDTIRPLASGDCADCFDRLPFLNPQFFLVLTGSSLGYLGIKSVPHPEEAVAGAVPSVASP